MKSEGYIEKKESIDINNDIKKQLENLGLIIDYYKNSLQN